MIPGYFLEEHLILEIDCNKNLWILNFNYIHLPTNRAPFWMAWTMPGKQPGRPIETPKVRVDFPEAEQSCGWDSEDGSDGSLSWFN